MKRDSFLAWMGSAAAFAGGAERCGAPSELAPEVRDLINVRTHGAVGDGTHDDTASIQSAIDAGRAGKPVLFPVGRYRVRQPLVLHDDTVLLGYGRHSVLWCTEPGCDVVLCSAKRVFFDGISLDGDATNRDGIVARHADDVRIRHCWIKSMGRRGVTVDDAPCAITDSTIELCGDDGIFVTGTNSGAPAHITTCYIFANRGNGLHFTGNGNQAMVLGSEIVNNAGCGIRIDTASNMISIVGNAIMGSGTDGVEISEGSRYTGLVGNVICECGRAAVSIRSGANATALTANRFVDNGKGGAAGVADVVIKESTETAIVGNIFARTSASTPQPVAILTDQVSVTHPLGNVFQGMVAPASVRTAP